METAIQDVLQCQPEIECVICMEKIKERISIDEEARRSATEKRAPPPTMILTCKLKVHKSHSDEACDNKQHDEGDEENAEKCVNLVTPNCIENVM